MNEKKKLRRLPKRILSFVLMMVMVLTLMQLNSVSVHAAGEPDVTATNVEIPTSLDMNEYLPFPATVENITTKEGISCETFQMAWCYLDEEGSFPGGNGKYYTYTDGVLPDTSKTWAYLFGVVLRFENDAPDQINVSINGKVFSGVHTETASEGAFYYGAFELGVLDENGNFSGGDFNGTSHTHGSWDYTASGATLTAECKAEGDCDLTDNKVSLTLTANSANYSGNPVTAGFSNTTAWTGAGLDLPAIEYYKGNTKLTSAPKEVGSYTAKATVGGKTASVSFEIKSVEKDPDPTPDPTPNPDPTPDPKPPVTPDNGKVDVQKDNEKGNFAAGGLASTVDEIKNAILTKEDKEAIASGADINVWVEIEDQSKNVSDTDKKKVSDKLPKSYNVGAYLDINLLKQIGTNPVVKVTEVPNGKVKVSITVPKALQKSGRTYKIIRIHNGVATVLDTTLGKDYNLTFETDGFSTYALIYADNADNKKETPEKKPAKTTTTTTQNTKVTSPKTGETSNALPLILTFIMVLSVVGLGFVRKMN